MIHLGKKGHTGTYKLHDGQEVNYSSVTPSKWNKSCLTRL